MRNTPICWLLLLFLASTFATACSSGEKTPIKKPVPVATAVAVQKTVPVQISAIGTVEAFNSVSVRSQITAQLWKVFFKEGQDVNKGDLLAKLDCRTLEAALAQARANLARDGALARHAEEQARRYAELLRREYVAREDYEQYQANAAALDATLKADEAVVASNLTQMQYCTIYSPITGRTGMLKIDQGNLVKADDDEILTINQINPINVSFAIPEKDLPRVKKHIAITKMKVNAFIPGEERPEVGDLSVIDNAIDKTTGTITLKGVFNNQEHRLVPGQFVNVVLILATEPNAIVVPSQSVEQGQEGPYVYVIRPDFKAEIRPVVAGEDVDGEMVILKGLKAGERVVTDGQMRLIPGSMVTVKSSH